MAQKAVKSREIDLKEAFSSFSVDDIGQAKEFYGKTLGLNVKEQEEGLRLDFDAGQTVFVYPKRDHKPASFTVLNFPVDDIDNAVDKLAELGVSFQSFDGEIKTDNKGIFRGAESGSGPNIAWFKDPAGNFFSLIEN